MARYELIDGTSSKFWEISLDGASFSVRYGRIGSDGQTQAKSFATADAALAEHDKLVREKTKKGYSLVGAPDAAAPAAPVVAAPVVAVAAPVVAAAAPAPKVASAPRAPAPPPAPVTTALGDGWIDGGNGYALSVQSGKIAARNAKGKVLASVPKELKELEPYQALSDALELLDAHEAECRESIEGWMLRSLPVPRAVIAAVWADESWRTFLENTVVTGSGGEGLLRGVGPRGLGVVTLDGDTSWIAEESVTIPHPILLGELDEWRALVAEMGARQGLSQLFRETFVRPTDKADETFVDEWSGAEFDLLAQAMNEARKGGWRVRAGAAICSTLEGGRVVEARYQLGEGDPMYETTTGWLTWQGPDGETLTRKEVGPVAWSEGMRMAATIYKKRKIEDKEDAE